MSKLRNCRVFQLVPFRRKKMWNSFNSNKGILCLSLLLVSSEVKEEFSLPREENKAKPENSLFGGLSLGIQRRDEQILQVLTEV